jgi:hypothetical protein
MTDDPDDTMEMFPELVHNWEDHWKDMPEFLPKPYKAIASVTIHFETVEAMEAFGELIGRRITHDTKGVYFPVKEKTTYICE